MDSYGERRDTYHSGMLCSRQQGLQVVHHDGGCGTGAGWGQSTPTLGARETVLVGQEQRPAHDPWRLPRASLSGGEVVMEDTDDVFAALALR